MAFIKWMYDYHKRKGVTMNQKMTETTYGVKIKRRKRKKLACEILYIIGWIAFVAGCFYLI